MNEFVRPLENDGISNIQFQKEEVITVSLGKEDVEYFEVPVLKDKELNLLKEWYFYK